MKLFTQIVLSYGRSVNFLIEQMALKIISFNAIFTLRNILLSPASFYLNGITSR